MVLGREQLLILAAACLLGAAAPPVAPAAGEAASPAVVPPSRSQAAAIADTAAAAARLQALLEGFVGEGTGVRNAVLLVECPGFAWRGAAGLAIPDSGRVMRPGDQFVIDSIGKMFTAAAVMKLVESGRIGLDDRIGTYLPDSLMADLHVLDGRSYGERITVRHLLSHRSGIADDWASPAFFELIAGDLQRRWRPEETALFVKERCPPAFPPGEGFLYTDVGYNLLGLVLERVTGQALHQVQRDLLLDPLGLAHTYRPSHEAPRPSLPGHGPSQRFLGDLECSLAPAVVTADWAGGGLVSTAEDLARFLRAFVRNEIFAHPTTKDLMLSWSKSGPYHGYGLGVSRIVYDESLAPHHRGLGELWGHRGSSNNFLYYWPRHDLVVVGTLNQVDLPRNFYDMLALILHAIAGTG